MGGVLREEKVAICEQCPLYRAPMVMSEGPPDAKIMFVGEAPSWEEVRTGRPFYGRAGQYLNGLLDETEPKIDRDEVYIANALKCQIPIDMKKQGKDIDQAIACCRQRLNVEIRRVAPKLLVALGDVALRSTVGKSGITKARGELHEPIDLLPTAPKVLPTFHPAYLLRGNEGYRGVVVRDLERAYRVATGGRATPRHPVVYRICQTFGEALVFLDELDRQKVIAFDSETSAFRTKLQRIVGTALDYQRANIQCMSFSWKEYEAWVLPRYGFKRVEVWTAHQWEVIRSRLKRKFEDPKTIWVIQNAPFDLRFLSRIDIDVYKINFRDLLVMMNLIDENSFKDLETLAFLFTDLGNYKTRMAKKLSKLRKQKKRKEAA